MFQRRAPSHISVLLFVEGKSSPKFGVADGLFGGSSRALSLHSRLILKSCACA
jgi:hypothetical protein